jgi:hypothetical protein
LKFIEIFEIGFLSNFYGLDLHAGAISPLFFSYPHVVVHPPKLAAIPHLLDAAPQHPISHPLSQVADMRELMLATTTTTAAAS